MGSHSGLVHTLGKRTCPKGYRGFESHPHRQLEFRKPEEGTSLNSAANLHAFFGENKKDLSIRQKKFFHNMNRKGFRNILLVITVIAFVGAGAYFVSTRQITPPPPSINGTPDARTLYEGYVGIESISLSEIKTKLEAQGCRTNDYKGETNNWCMYRETEVPYFKENGIEIYPHGPGFGPISFYVTENKLWAGKDIPGTPNPDNFKVVVRQDVKDIGNILKIKENSWKITKTEYPWTVIY